MAHCFFNIVIRFFFLNDKLLILIFNRGFVYILYIDHSSLHIKLIIVRDTLIELTCLLV